MTKRNQGFTIVELLFVIFFIGATCLVGTGIFLVFRWLWLTAG